MLMSKKTLGTLILVSVIAPAACSEQDQHTTAISTVTPPPTQTLKVVPRPQKIVDLAAQRGEEEQAKPILKIIEPANNSTIEGPTVRVRLSLSGDLKGYQPHKDQPTGTGNHIHVVLDNQPYEAYYELHQSFELRNVVSGKHTLRVFPSRPWHESYKNDGAFQLVMFTVRNGGDVSKPTTSSTGQKVADNAAASTREGNDMKPSTAGDVDPAKPLLTYSRPKGEYKGGDANPIMIDFWLTNAKLKGDAGEFRVRYIIDDDEPRYLDKWEPIWLEGWLSGKHTVRIELLDKDSWPIENGGYNTTTREIIVVR